MKLRKGKGERGARGGGGEGVVTVSWDIYHKRPKMRQGCVIMQPCVRPTTSHRWVILTSNNERGEWLKVKRVRQTDRWREDEMESECRSKSVRLAMCEKVHYMKCVGGGCTIARFLASFPVHFHFHINSTKSETILHFIATNVLHWKQRKRKILQFDVKITKQNFLR